MWFSIVVALSDWMAFLFCEEVTVGGRRGRECMRFVVRDMYLTMDMLFELLLWEGEYL